MQRSRGQGDVAGTGGGAAALPAVGKAPGAGIVQRKAADAPAVGKTTPTDIVQRKAGGGAPSDPAAVTAIAERGLGGGGGELPHRERLEQGFGVDLSGVRAHTGDGAAGASREIGAEAYTMGSDIAFASSSPSPELVAHEVAHVIQQGAGAGPAGGVGTAGDRFEQEADAAASTVAGGGRSDLASSYAPAGAAGALQRKAVQRYESAEHAMIGDGMTYPVVLSPMELPNHARATRGELIAFGDFYGSYDAIAQAPREETEALIGIIRWEAIWTLAGRQQQQGTPTGDAAGRTGLETAAEPDDSGVHGGHAAHHGRGDLVTWDGAAFDAEVAGVKLRDKAREIHAQFTPAWQFFGINVPLSTFSHAALTVHHMKATLGRRRFRNTNNTLGSPRQDDETPPTTDPRTSDPAGLGGDYFDLASNNLSHFAITNWATWEHYHRQVCDRVATSPGDPAAVQRAVIEDSWGCHYLTDMYASGHAVDKQALMGQATTMMVDMSQAHGLSEAGDNRHDVIADMLTESLQLAFRDDTVYRAWQDGCRNAFDQGLVREDELELMLTVPRGTQWSDGLMPSVVGNLVATIMGMPWRNFQPNGTAGGDRPGGGQRENGESFGPGNQPQGEGDYHLGAGNLAALTVHNALNAIGFEARNGLGETWRMQGDSHLTAATQAMAQRAVDVSTEQARTGHFEPERVKELTPQAVRMDPAWVTQYLADRQASGRRYDPGLQSALMTKVAALAEFQPMTSGDNATVSAPLAELCTALMRLEFTAPSDEYEQLVAQERARAREGTGDGIASMNNTGINIAFLREFLKENLPRMVPVAYASASAGDLPPAALEIYQPRDASGNFLPTAANDFRWDGSNVTFRLNVSGCTPGQTYTLGIKVHDQDAGLDYLPTGQLEASPAGRDDDEVYGRSGEDPEASWPLQITLPANLQPGPNGSAYVDASWTLTGRGDANHAEHYIRVFADEACTMVIGRSSAQGSGETSNPAPIDPRPRTTGPDRQGLTNYTATGVDSNAFAWDGNSVRFRLSSNAPPGAAPETPVRAWIKQFNQDAGYDYDEAGRLLPTEFFEPRDDDSLVGGPTMVSAALVELGGSRTTQQVVFNAVDNDNNTYIIVYADAGCTQPLARSHVQGTNRGRVREARPLAAATGANAFSWAGNRLSFAVTPPGAAKVWVKLFDKDSGYDYDTSGTLMSGSRDEDEQVGGIREVPVARGRASVEATGDAAHEDTYAIVYADPGCTTPLGRSNARG